MTFACVLMSMTRSSDLHMAVGGVQVADGEERLQSLGARLADADQQARGERHLLGAGRCYRGGPRRWLLQARAAECSTARSSEPHVERISS
jgi:hypothetical protein